MVSANYGRMRAGRCLPESYDKSGQPHKMGCAEDILRYHFHFHSDLHREYCNWETFSASCAAGQVVLMTSAHYGRMRAGRCVELKYDNEGNPDPIGCTEDIIRYLILSPGL